MTKAIVWSKQMCPYCDMAKNMLKTKGIEFEERKIGEEWSKEQLVESVPGARSVPQIFIDDKHIGGYDDLKKYFE